MPDSDNSGFDPFGAKAVGEATKTVTKAVVDGAGAFLGRICLPAAEEFGLLMQDKVRHWRAANTAKTVDKAAKLAAARLEAEDLQAHPRMLGEILNEASWADSDVMQSHWAGLLASSCTDGSDQSNLIFIRLLSQLTPSEAAVVSHGCKATKVALSPAGLLLTLHPVFMDIQDLLTLTGHTDIHRQDLELDHLRELGLLTPAGGFDNLNPGPANITPSALALQFFARLEGFVGSPRDYYDAQHVDPVHFWGVQVTVDEPDQPGVAD